MRLATDINNDGRGDLVLASPGNDAISSDAGAVHVFFGTPLPVPDMSSAQAELTALPAVAGTTFGAPVVSGDLDGDGQAELVIGAPGDDQLARDGGAVFVFGGPLGPSPAALQPAQARQTFASARQNDRLGKAIVLHDLDRNGFLDLLIGAPGRAPGTVFVYLGGPGGPDTQAVWRPAISTATVGRRSWSGPRTPSATWRNRPRATTGTRARCASTRAGRRSSPRAIRSPG
jgi:hypothetical protein